MLTLSEPLNFFILESMSNKCGSLSNKSYMKCHYNVNVAHSVMCFILTWNKNFCCTRNWVHTFTTTHIHINLHFLITVESAASQALFKCILNVTCWFSIIISSICEAYTPVPDALAQPVWSLSWDVWQFVNCATFSNILLKQYLGGSRFHNAEEVKMAAMNDCKCNSWVPIAKEF